jgi:hypothetical protein
MKILVLLTFLLPGFVLAEAIETQKYSKGDIEAEIPIGFTYVDLSEENPDAYARGYFESPDESVRFYIERARPNRIFYNSKHEAIYKAETIVKGPYYEGVEIENQLTVRPFDKTAGDYTRYLVIEAASQTAGGSTQLGIQTNSQEDYEKWKPAYIKFKDTVVVDEGH